MRFVSQHRGYHIALRPAAIGGYSPTGEALITKNPLVAEFQQGAVLPWETDAAVAHWDGHWKGLADGVDPRSRLSGFDTEWAALEYEWTEDDRAYVEKKLLNLPGRIGVDYIQVEEKKSPLPWPTYKTLRSPERIVAFMREGGFDPELVLRYERENEGREEIIEAVENAGHEDEDAEVVVRA